MRFLFIMLICFHAQAAIKDHHFAALFFYNKQGEPQWESQCSNVWNRMQVEDQCGGELFLGANACFIEESQENYELHIFETQEECEGFLEGVSN